MLTDSITNDIKHQFHYGSIVMKLILVNVAVFLIYALINVVSYFTQSSGAITFLTENLFAYSSWGSSLHKPWTIITYQFMHVRFLHILFNMLWLYWFGEIFILYIGEKKILPLYIAGGFFGWLIYASALHFIPVLKPMAEANMLYGASASVMAIVFAAVALHPDHKMNLMFVGEVSIKYIAIVSLLVDLIDVPEGGAGTYFSHLGGALLGYSYIKLLQSGVNLPPPIEKIKNIFNRGSKVKVAYKNTDYKKSSEKPVGKNEQQRVDEILDKIARSGYDSLTKEEKDFLFNYSKK